MSNQRKEEAILVCLLIAICAILLTAVIFMAIKSKSKIPESGYGETAYYCPVENKKSMAQFIDNCTGAHSEAYCYALAKGEFCRIVRRF